MAGAVDHSLDENEREFSRAMAADTSPADAARPLISFGRFEFYPRQRLLLRDGERIALGSRALDILAALLEAPGELLSKDMLLAKVWPNIHVEETSLRVHIAAIRRALDQGGESLIGTVPGRGYAFVGVVSAPRSLGAAPSSEKGTAGEISVARPALPHSVNRVLGREDTIAETADNLEHHRCVSITGAGGMGKTTVALAVAERLRARFAGDVVFVDLSPVQDQAFVSARLAAAIEVSIGVDNPIVDLANALRDSHMLIVLDNCEHVIAGAAELVEELLRYTKGIRFLVTSREPLHVEGEWTQRISSLDIPRRIQGLSADEAMSFSAIELFVERAAQSLGGFSLGYGEAAHVAEICRNLDGNALAIEFAASRLGVLSVGQLAAQLDDRFHLLKSGRRSALPRHQTLRAMLDWSYDLLCPKEQELLIRLAHFQSSFTLDAAIAFCGNLGLSAAEVTEGIFELVDKSLVTALRGEPEMRYRLLYTTRAYGRERLADAGWTQQTARAHAEYLLATFERLSPGREPFAFLEGNSEEAPEVEELRSALKWAFSDEGEDSIGVSLTISALPLWWQLSAIDESLEWVERALDTVDGRAEADALLLMTLHSALGGLQMYATSRVRKARGEWEKTFEIATSAGNVEYQLRALRALWSKSLNEGQFSRSLQYGLDFRDIALRAGWQREAALAGRFIGTAEHFLGRHEDAEASTRQMLEDYVGTPREDIVRFQFDQRISARLVSGRIPAIRGQFDMAMAIVEQDVADAMALGHTLTTCCLLSQSACPIALLAEDYEALQRYQSTLRALTDSRALDIWNRYAVCYDALLKIDTGQAEAGLEELTPALDALHRSGFNHFRTSFLLARHNALEMLGREAEAVASVDEALSICALTGEAWLLPELLRARAAHDEHARPTAALKRYQTALTLASNQGALAWELRIACGIARLQFRSLSPDDGKLLLSSVFERCVEGRCRRDYIEAQNLLGV